MSNKINIEGLKRENNFKVPAHYFDSLEIDIQVRIKEKKCENFFFRFKYPSIAFTISCFAFCVWLVTKKEVTPLVVSPAEVDFVSYVNENIDEFDDELIYETYTSVASIEVSTTELNKIKNTEALDEYLLDEGVDEEELLDEL